MSENIKQFDLKNLAEGVVQNPAPQSCAEIAALFESLPLRGSLSSPPPTAEQKKAFAMLQEKAKAPTPEEIRYMAEICCTKYHRIRYENRFWPRWETAKALYGQYYEATGCEEVKYILDHFDDFMRLCFKSIDRRQRKDDFELYLKNTSPSTSRDPDSSEWKK